MNDLYSSYILTPELARDAMSLARPSIEAFLGSVHTGADRKGIAVVILGPGTNRILAEELFGESDDFERYKSYALEKARLAKEHQMPTRRIIQESPALLRRGDITYAGGVYEGGVAVGASGLQSRYDVMIAWWVLNAVFGLLDDFIERMHPNAPAFLGEENYRGNVGYGPGRDSFGPKGSRAS